MAAVFVDDRAEQFAGCLDISSAVVDVTVGYHSVFCCLQFGMLHSERPMPTSIGTRIGPVIASFGIHEIEVTEFSCRMPPPR